LHEGHGDRIAAAEKECLDRRTWPAMIPTRRNRTVAMALARVKGEQAAETRLLTPNLTERQSTAVR